MTGTPDPALPSQILLTLRVHEFLVHETALLDAWDLDRWLELFDEDARYEIPSTEFPELGAYDSQYFISDDLDRLRARVKRLMSKNAHAENPRSRLLHMVGNVAATELGADRVGVEANVVVHRFRDGRADSYFGRYRHVVRCTPEGGFRYERRRVEIVQETLSPSGRLSFIF